MQQGIERLGITKLSALMIRGGAPERVGFYGRRSAGFAMASVAVRMQRGNATNRAGAAAGESCERLFGWGGHVQASLP